MAGFEDIMQWLTMMNPGAGAGAAAGVGGSMDPQAAMAILADPDSAAASLAKGGMRATQPITGGGGETPPGVAGTGRPDPTMPPSRPVIPQGPQSTPLRMPTASASNLPGIFDNPDPLAVIEGVTPPAPAPGWQAANWATPPGVTSAPGTAVPAPIPTSATGPFPADMTSAPSPDISHIPEPKPGAAAAAATPTRTGFRSEAGDTERAEREKGITGETEGKKGEKPAAKKKDEKKTDWAKKLEGTLGALKYVAPPAPVVTAPPRPGSVAAPPAYRANPQTMQMLMQLLQGPAGAQAPTPTLSQLMGR